MRRKIIWQNTFRLDPSSWRPGAATRCTLALAVPLLGGALSGHPAWGVAMSIGAFNAGLLSLNGVYRARLRQMLGVSALVAVMALMAGLVGTSPVLTVLLVVAASFGLTLYAEGVPGASITALQATITVIIISGLRFGPGQALITAVLILAGALLQVLALGLVWPVDPYQPERRAVAEVYGALARYVEGFPVDLRHAFPDEAPFQAAQTVLREAAHYRWRREHAELLAALNRAEGLRAALIALARADGHLSRAGGDRARQVRRVSQLLARLLRTAARQLRGQRRPLVPEDGLHMLGEASDRIARSLTGAAAGEVHALQLVRSLLSGLNATPSGAAPPQPPPAAPPPTVRALLARPEARLHALRYAVAMGGATALYQFTHLAHGYWLPLTVGLVLRQDYFTTVTRGLARLGGTLIGVALAELIGLAHPGRQVGSLLVLAAAWLAYALLPVGYAAFSAAVTLYVVFSLSASGVSEAAAGLTRLGFTLAGGVLALVAFLAWPLWRSRQAAGVLQRAATSQAEWGRAVLTFARGAGNSDVEGLRAAARRARLEAEGAVQAASVEPNWAVSSRQRQALGEQLARLSEGAALLVSLQLEAQSGQTDGLLARIEAAVGVSDGLAGPDVPDPVFASDGTKKTAS